MPRPRSRNTLIPRPEAPKIPNGPGKGTDLSIMVSYGITVGLICVILGTLATTAIAASIVSVGIVAFSC